MKLSNPKRFFSILAVVACLALPLTATASVEVRIFDSEGNLQNNVGLVVYDEDGNLMHKFQGLTFGVYVVNAIPGQKLTLEAGSSDVGFFGKFDEVVPGDGKLDLVLEGAPANDLCIDAIPLMVPDAVLGSTLGATDDPEAAAVDFCGTSIAAPGVWYTVVGTGNTITADLCNPGTGYDTKINVFCLDCDDLTCVGGNDDSGGQPSFCSTLSWCSQPGNTYRVLVQGFGGDTGPFELTISDSGAPCSAGVDCSPPVGTGACCSCLAPPFNCTTETMDDCMAMGSDYQGDDTECFMPSGAEFDYVTMPGVDIPDNVDEGIIDVFTVPDDFIIGDLDVDLIVPHTFLGDLEVRLIHPSGEPVVMLWDNNCGSNDDVDVIFDDDGAPLLCDTPTTGVVDPTTAGGGDLSAFEGLMSGGDWILSIADTLGGDTGTLVQWSLHFDEGIGVCPDTPDGDDDGKVVICHFPPGNPANAQTLSVGAASVPAHILNHGDTEGACMESGLVDDDIDVVTDGPSGGMQDLEAGDGSVEDTEPTATPGRSRLGSER